MTLTEKRNHLTEIKAKLKSQFFGIDDQIDRIVDSIRTWYLMPEVLTRPPIINLWGMTGVGKTAVIRALVRELKWSDKYFEIEMSNGGGSIISSILDKGGVLNSNNILLLDEWQRFRHIDEDKKELRGIGYKDVWPILSDGRVNLSCDVALMYDEVYWMFENLFMDKNMNKHILVTEYNIFFSRIKDFIKKFGNNQERDLFSYKGADVVSKLTIQEGKKIVDDIYLRVTSDPVINFSKTLIIISGNLDDAFSMSQLSGDADTDADTFHTLSKEVSVTSIKNALGKRFKPEQIARLGNNHIIYPALSKKAYNQIIKNSIDGHLLSYKDKFDIDFTYSQSVLDNIYVNSVYPTQGTRPVFSSIDLIFCSTIAEGIAWCLENNEKNVKIELDLPKKELKLTGKRGEISLNVNLDIHEAKKKDSQDYRAMVSVHEMGHAIVYAELFNETPLEIKTNVSSFKGGYILTGHQMLSKNNLFDRIAVCYGGTIAEEIVFGRENISSGCHSDIVNATKYATTIVRELGMNGIDGRVSQVSTMDSSCIQSSEKDNASVEKILKESKENARNILNKHKNLLIKCSQELLIKAEFTPEYFRELTKDHISYKMATDSKDTFVNYYEILTKQ